MTSGGLEQQRLLISLLFCFDVCRGLFGFADPHQNVESIDSNVVAGSLELIDDQRVSQNAPQAFWSSQEQGALCNDKKRRGS
jgi:hypothetical protein